ncbi:antibiotic synthesis protein MbtH [Streptomyces sp. WM6372]|uniref:MbtH family protein n=1 Tax=Streptomyces TaxID=1883 RepID=UPI0006B015A0|nr:MbtH family NRPS accessory protein [Streptomyces sp. WM6372]KOU21920.1 antibiotic synthesis protein MbtH [Streptomyces sp. WM6372]
MFDDEEREFCVVRNSELQYSIWPAGRDLPAGWSEVGTRGRKAECLAYLDRSWTDLRPASLRRSLSGHGEIGRPTSDV